MPDVALVKRINDALAETRVTFFAPLKLLSKNRILEIDILRAIAILLIVLYHFSLVMIPARNVNDSLTLIPQLGPTDLLGFLGMSIFFFISGFSLYLRHKIISNRQEALIFYKKRVVRIYPLYWFFVAGILILYRPSLGQAMIYVAGLQAAFSPLFTSVPLYHFISVILIFYLLFPMIVFFEDYKKMLVVSLIPLLFLVAITPVWPIDSMFLMYYGLFVGGIIAGKMNVYDLMRKAKFTPFLVLTVPLFATLSYLWLICLNLYSSVFVSVAFVINFFGLLTVLVVLFWAVFYVRVFNTRFYAFFTFLAFSTYGVFFLNLPFFLSLSTTLNSRFHVHATATAAIVAASIPLLVMAGYLLQLITNQVVNFPKSSQKL